MVKFSFSQWVESILAAVSLILYFATGDQVIGVAFLMILIVSITILVVGKPNANSDLMFMDDKAFFYEQHYENWRAKNEGDY